MQFDFKKIVKLIMCSAVVGHWYLTKNEYKPKLDGTVTIAN